MTAATSPEQGAPSNGAALAAAQADLAIAREALTEQDALRQRIEAQEAELRSLERASERSEEAYRRARERFEIRTAQAQALERTVKQLDEDLRRRNKEVLRLQSEIAAVLYSTSWRLTRPLRVLSRLLRRG